MMTSTAASGPVSAAGEAQVTVGPVPTWQRWEVLSVAVQLSAGNAEARVYLGPTAQPGAFLEGTYSGGRDTTSWAPGALELAEGEQLTVRWTDATAEAIGATATAVVRYRARSAR